MINKDNRAIEILTNRILSMVEKQFSKLSYDKTFPSVVYGINDDGT